MTLFAIGHSGLEPDSCEQELSPIQSPAVAYRPGGYGKPGTLSALWRHNGELIQQEKLTTSKDSLSNTGPALVALLIALALIMACNQTSEGAHAGAPVEWGYSGEGGPATWGSLSDKYSSCSEGKRQSPVDIAGYLPGDASALSFTYSRDGRHLTNTGKFVKVTRGNSRMRLQEREYTLMEVHSHNPSEHSIDGKSFALEMHLVHKGESGEIAVVGVLYRLGEENPAIQAMIDAAPQPSETVEPDSPLEPSGYLPAQHGHYSYSGSLTTPPCTEGVEWLIMSEIEEVSQEQVRQIADLTGGRTNNRPVQPLGDRRIAVSE